MAFSIPIQKTDRPPKRGRTEANQLKPVSQVETFAKYLVIHSEEENAPLAKKSVFLVAKCLESVVGRDYHAKKLASGDLLVEVQRKNQSQNLLKQDTLAGLKVTVTPHRTLNTTQGVISERELLHETDEDLLDGLKDQGVTAVRRITMRRAGEEIRTKHIVLTFGRPSLPESVHAAFISCPVRPYIPSPRRCFRCQKYGHGTQSCRGRPTCAHCARADHTSDDCKKEQVKCPNCGEPHPAYSRACPAFKKEKEIIQLKVTENLTFAQARLKHALLSGRSYADAARRGVERRLVDAGTQYDLVPPQPPAQQQKAPPVASAATPSSSAEPKASNTSSSAAPKASSTSTSAAPKASSTSSGAAPKASSTSSVQMSDDLAPSRASAKQQKAAPVVTAVAAMSSAAAAAPSTNSVSTDTPSPETLDEAMDVSPSTPARETQPERRSSVGRGKNKSKPPKLTTPGANSAT